MNLLSKRQIHFLPKMFALLHSKIEESVLFVQTSAVKTFLLSIEASSGAQVSNTIAEKRLGT